MTKKLFVVGAGFMGHGIAQVCASAGCEVTLYDAAGGAVDRALEKIGWSLRKLKEKDPSAPEPGPVLGRLRIGRRLEDALEAEIVIEAAPEDLAIKTEIFRMLDKICPEKTLFCSNTSAIPITALAAATQRPARFCGLHFFSPVVLMRLVEVIRGLETAEETITAALAFVRKIGKEPVEVRKDVAGFVVNRILASAGLEAMRLLEAGVADAEAIDRAMRLGCGHKMGPLATIDMAGLDVALAAVRTLQTETGEARFAPPAILLRLVAAGHLGRKTGRGFFTYDLS